NRALPRPPKDQRDRSGRVLEIRDQSWCTSRCVLPAGCCVLGLTHLQHLLRHWLQAPLMTSKCDHQPRGATWLPGEGNHLHIALNLVELFRAGHFLVTHVTHLCVSCASQKTRLTLQASLPCVDKRRQCFML